MGTLGFDLNDSNKFRLCTYTYTRENGEWFIGEISRPSGNWLARASMPYILVKDGDRWVRKQTFSLGSKEKELTFLKWVESQFSASLADLEETDETPH